MQLELSDQHQLLAVIASAVVLIKKSIRELCSEAYFVKKNCIGVFCTGSCFLKLDICKSDLSSLNELTDPFTRTSCLL